MLYLYQNINPNYDDNIHYYFEDFAKYKTALSNSLFATLNVDNYRINTEICKIGFNEGITALNAQSITYIIDERDNYKRCYYVRGFVIESNKIIYRLEMDYWASFIDVANLSDMWIKRCNRRLENPIYDEAMTQGNPIIEYLPISNATMPPQDETGTDVKANEFISNAQLMIVLAITYNTNEISGASVTESRLFGAMITENNIEEVIEKYGGLCSVTLGSDTNLASITGAWIIDKCNITLTNKTRTFNFKKGDGTTSQETLSCVNILDNVERTYSYISTDADYVYYFGTYNNNMKLKAIGTNVLKIRYVLSNDHINVIACNGDNQEDITSAFAIGLSSTNGELRESRLLAQQLQNGLKLVGSASSILNTSNPLSMATGLLGMGSSVIGSIDSWKNADNIGHVVKGGDGYGTFNHVANNTHGSFKNPIMILKYSALQYGKKHVNRYGAIFNYDYFSTYSSLMDMLNLPFVTTGSITTNLYTYIMASVDVDGIPIEASDTIKNIFAKGVRIEFIE